MIKYLLALMFVVLSCSVFAANNTLFVSGYAVTNSSRVYDFNISIYNSTGYVGSYNVSSVQASVAIPTNTSSGSGVVVYTAFLNGSILTSQLDVTGSSGGYHSYYRYNIYYSNGSTMQTETSPDITGSYSVPYIFTSSNISYTTPINRLELYRISASGSTSVCYYGCAYSYATPGYINASLANGSYRFVANDTRFASTSQNYTLSGSTYDNLTLNLYSTNTIVFTVENENTQSIINTTTVNITLSGSVLGYNYSTTTGTVSATLLITDNYTITVSANGYSTRTYLAEVSSNTVQSITLYLLPTPYSTLLISDVDQTYQSVPQYTNSLLRLNSSGSNYFEVERCNGDVNGQCLVSANICSTNDSSCPFYKVVVYDSTGSVIGATGGIRLNQNTLVMVLNTNQNNINAISDHFGLSQSLGSWNTTNATITYTLDNSNNLVSSSELVVQRRLGANWYTVFDSTTTGIGTQIITSSAVDTSIGEEYRAFGYYTTSDGVVHLGDTDSFIPSNSGLGISKNAALPFVSFGLNMAPLLLFGMNPILSVVASIIVTFFTYTIGLSSFTATMVSSIAVIGFIVLMLVFK